MENTKIYYAGIGSRRTPGPVLEQMRRIASILASVGYVLRSGAADGADMAFEAGCVARKGASEIWLPWRDFNNHADTGFYPTDAHFELASKTHPAWVSLTRGPRALHARNMGQVLGSDLATPVQFVLCWTPDGCESEATRTRDTGGTGGAITLASRHGIPVFNLANADALDRLMAHPCAPRRKLHADGTTPQNGEVFVFGSNLAGRHGKGAALVAKEKFGAVPGVGRGRQGQSYGIPTKQNGPVKPGYDRPSLVIRDLEDIKKDIRDFNEYATYNSKEEFFVTRVACDLAGFADGQIAPLFSDAPETCSFPEPWEPWLGKLPLKALVNQAGQVKVAEAINIWSGSRGIGGALTNMSERAKEKGFVKNSYPVTVNEVRYVDSEAAYQALKVPGEDAYNDGLMVDIIALKFAQNPVLMEVVAENGGVAWLEKCSHFTGAVSARFQAWEGQGYGSRFITNLVHGYQKALNGRGLKTRVVHVKEAPFDVYIGRAMGNGFTASLWQNPFKVGPEMQRDEAIKAFAAYLKGKPELMAQVHTLKGATLGCWCKQRENIHTACHGDVLAALAEGQEWVPPQDAQGSLF